MWNVWSMWIEKYCCFVWLRPFFWRQLLVVEMFMDLVSTISWLKWHALSGFSYHLSRCHLCPPRSLRSSVPMLDMDKGQQQVAQSWLRVHKMWMAKLTLTLGLSKNDFRKQKKSLVGKWCSACMSTHCHTNCHYFSWHSLTSWCTFLPPLCTSTAHLHYHHLNDDVYFPKGL